MRFTLIALVVPAVLFAASWFALRVGHRLGARRHRKHEAGGQLGTVQGGALGLLGLLLGFAFSGATSRFIARDEIIVQEANAIGTAYLRADLLDEPARSTLRASLRRYAADRVELFDARWNEHTAELRARIASDHDQMWKTALAGVESRPQSAIAVLPPLNEVFDLLSTHEAAERRHLPFMVLALLIACALVSLGTIGYGFGLQGLPYSHSAGPFAMLIATALWVTIDMEYPRAGLIQVSNRPLVQVRDGLAP